MDGVLPSFAATDFNRGDDVLLGLRLVLRRAHAAQEIAGEHGARPGAEVLRGEVLAGDFAQVFVDVGGVDGVTLAFFVNVLEELVPGEVFTLLDDACEAAVLQADGVVDLALTLEAEGDLRAVDLDVLVAQRGQAVAAVFLGVLLIPDADVRLLHEADDGGEHLFARKAGEAQVLLHALANQGQRLRELDHALILGFVADLAPPGMVAALLAAPGIAAGGLEMAVGDGADPDAGPGGRDDERTDAAQRVFVMDGRPTRRGVTKTLSAADAANARLGVGDVAETGCLRRFFRIRRLNQRVEP